MKCVKILSIREKLKLKYSEVDLPSKIEEVHGYHLNCYKNFTSINRKYLTDDSTSQDPSTSTLTPFHSETSLIETPTSQRRRVLKLRLYSKTLRIL